MRTNDSDEEMRQNLLTISSSIEAIQDAVNLMLAIISEKQFERKLTSENKSKKSKPASKFLTLSRALFFHITKSILDPKILIYGIPTSKI